MTRGCLALTRLSPRDLYIPKTEREPMRPCPIYNNKQGPQLTSGMMAKAALAIHKKDGMDILERHIQMSGLLCWLYDAQIDKFQNRSRNEERADRIRFESILVNDSPNFT